MWYDSDGRTETDLIADRLSDEIRDSIRGLTKRKRGEVLGEVAYQITYCVLENAGPVEAISMLAQNCVEALGHMTTAQVRSRKRDTVLLVDWLHGRLPGMVPASKPAATLASRLNSENDLVRARSFPACRG